MQSTVPISSTYILSLILYNNQMGRELLFISILEMRKLSSEKFKQITYNTQLINDTLKPKLECFSIGNSKIVVKLIGFCEFYGTMGHYAVQCPLTERLTKHSLF